MKNFLEYLKNFEPVVWKTVVGGIVTLALIWGVDLSFLGDQINQSLDVLVILLPALSLALTGLWIRKSVTAPGNTAAVLDKDGNTVAGPALDAPTGTPVDIYEFPTTPEVHEPQHMS